MKALLALLAVAALLWWLRDRRTPELKLADAVRDNDGDYLTAHLPRLDEKETQTLIDRVVYEQDEEIRDGKGNESFDKARFARYEIEERQAKWERTRPG